MKIKRPMYNDVNKNLQEQRDGDEETGINDDDDEIHQEVGHYKQSKKATGSLHGLQDALEEQTAARVHQIPVWLQPIILGILTMLNALLRWASLVYIAASVSIMLISGMELALSVVAARFIRKRMVSYRRWLGVFVVVIGIILIGLSDVLLGDASESGPSGSFHSSRQRSIGIALTLGKGLVKMLQDITEEMFMQVGEFPPMLLLGLEGAIGLVFGLLLFFTVGDALGDGRIHTMASLQAENNNTNFLIKYSIGLTLLFTATGICNIKATQVTCAMTRNVWKNMRTVLVWVIALGVYYLGGNDANLGEAFVIPDSLVILLGFAVMLVGIFVYYSNKAKEESEAAAAAASQHHTKAKMEMEEADEATYLLSASPTSE